MDRTTSQAVEREGATRTLAFADLGAALRGGMRDFLAAPHYGLFFAGIYVAGGWLLGWAAQLAERAWLLIPLIAGFPLFAPFAAVGLYEVSRRRETGEPLSWRAVLGALRGRGDEQLILMGGILFVGFAFWMMIAHVLMAVFMDTLSIGRADLPALAEPNGLAMLALGTAIGGLFAFALYAVSVVSLPMMLDRDTDLIRACGVSLRTVARNAGVMFGWAALIALLLMLAMVPALLGLLLALPILGHATWHLYRRAVG